MIRSQIHNLITLSVLHSFPVFLFTVHGSPSSVFCVLDHIRAQERAHLHHSAALVRFFAVGTDSEVDGRGIGILTL
jgi:hypothetical protein